MNTAVIKHSSTSPSSRVVIPLNTRCSLSPISCMLSSMDAGRFAVEMITTVIATPSTEAQQQRKEGSSDGSSATAAHPILSRSPNTQSTSNIKRKKQIAPTTAPNRVLCRAVAEKYLSWDLQDRDFVLPDDFVGTYQAQEGGGALDGDRARGAGEDAGNSIEEHENILAVRAALTRRERKLSEALSGVHTNDEVGGLASRHRGSG